MLTSRLSNGENQNPTNLNDWTNKPISNRKRFSGKVQWELDFWFPVSRQRRQKWCVPSPLCQKRLPRYWESILVTHKFDIWPYCRTIIAEFSLFNWMSFTLCWIWLWLPSLLLRQCVHRSLSNRLGFRTKFVPTPDDRTKKEWTVDPSLELFYTLTTRSLSRRHPSRLRGAGFAFWSRGPWKIRIIYSFSWLLAIEIEFSPVDNV